MEVQFADQELEGAILKSDLEGLTKLESKGQQGEIAELSGIEYCTNLRALDLGRTHQISDISSLSSLTNLQTLYLRGNQITDISPLSNLINLQDLHLEDNRISDISPLSSLTYLPKLYLSGNQISDISHLASNAGIGWEDVVDLKGNPLNDEAYELHIPALQDKGVEVVFDLKP